MAKFYDGVEDLSGFSTLAQILNYRNMLLRKTEQQSTFIQRVVGRERFSALELCSGNGRLLVDLALRGGLERGLGVDSAASRVDFARRWARDEHLRGVDFCCGDVLGQGYDCYDAAICITGAFQYFPRVSCPGDSMDLLVTMERAAPMCILELYDEPEWTQRQTSMKVWEALPAEDPYAYYLKNYLYNAEGRFMYHEKVFIGRDGTIDDGRSEILYYYAPAEIKCLLTEVGYTKIDLYSNWQGDPYQPNYGSMIVVGRKQ